MTVSPHKRKRQKKGALGFVGDDLGQALTLYTLPPWRQTRTTTSLQRNLPATILEDLCRPQDFRASKFSNLQRVNHIPVFLLTRLKCFFVRNILSSPRRALSHLLFSVNCWSYCTEGTLVSIYLFSQSLSTRSPQCHLYQRPSGRAARRASHVSPPPRRPAFT